GRDGADVEVTLELLQSPETSLQHVPLSRGGRSQDAMARTLFGCCCLHFLCSPICFLTESVGMAFPQNLQRLLQQPKPAAPLLRDFYSDEALYAADLELVFYKEWLFVGHTSEVPGAGSYFTVQIGAYPIVVVRGNDGRIRAFLNSCRHRGARICRESHGESPKLVCPYHQWTYNLDGRLFAARQMGPGFDRSRHGLKSVHCEAVAGYVFVCLADVAPDFSAIRRQFAAYVAPHAIDQARVAFTSTIIEEGNWKLVWENNRE